MLSASALRLVARELKELVDKPEDGIQVSPNGDNLAEVIADYDGPAGTPYEGGSFRLRLDLGPDFPTAPPKGTFLTKVFHPNVSAAGEVCVNVLKKDWQADLGLRHVLVVVRCLLIEPFAESALNEEAGRLLLEDFEEFARRARLVTSIHATSGRGGGGGGGACGGGCAGPLTAAGGANAVNGADGVDEGEGEGGGGGGVGGAPGGAGSAQPAAAAAKAAKAAAVKKRSLKRL